VVGSQERGKNMSKRYGRSQKRKHREKIARISEAYDRELGLLRYTSRRLDDIERKYKDVCEEIRRIVPNSSLLEPEEILKDGQLPPYFRVPKREKLMAIPLESLGPMEAAEYHAITLELIGIAAEYDEFHNRQHIKIQSRFGSAAYYMTRQAIIDNDINWLAKEVAERSVVAFRDAIS
jgi:hypothetical protein